MKPYKSNSRAYLSIRPLLTSATHYRLDRVLAEAALQAFTRLIDIYGVGEFRFNICERSIALGEVSTYFF